MAVHDGEGKVYVVGGEVYVGGGRGSCCRGEVYHGGGRFMMEQVRFVLEGGGSCWRRGSS